VFAPVKSVCDIALSKVTGFRQDDRSSSPDRTFLNIVLNGMFTMLFGPTGIIFDV
jgi:hypothetical protein